MTVLSSAADSSCVTSRVDGSGLRITDVSSWATPRHLHLSLLSLLISGSGTLLISWLCTSTSLFVCSMAETIPISDAFWFLENINWGFFTNRRNTLRCVFLWRKLFLRWQCNILTLLSKWSFANSKAQISYSYKKYILFVWGILLQGKVVPPTILYSLHKSSAIIPVHLRLLIVDVPSSVFIIQLPKKYALDRKVLSSRWCKGAFLAIAINQGLREVRQITSKHKLHL